MTAHWRAVAFARRDMRLAEEAAAIAARRPDAIRLSDITRPSTAPPDGQVIDIHARLTDREHTPTASPPHGFRDARRRHRALAALARITNGAR